MKWLQKINGGKLTMLILDYTQGTIRGSCRAGEIKAKGLFKASIESDVGLDIYAEDCAR